MNMMKSEILSKGLLQKRMIQILLRSRRRKTPQDVDTLIRLTSELQFFVEINSKNSNVRADLHRKIVQQWQQMRVQKGSFIFIEGYHPDYFYILINGLALQLVSKSTQEINKERRLGNQSYLFLRIKNLEHELRTVAKLKGRPEITVRALMVLRFLQRVVIKLIYILYYFRNGKFITKKGRQKYLTLEVMSQSLSASGTPLSSVRQTSMTVSIKGQRFVYNEKTTGLNSLFCQRLYCMIRRELMVLFPTIQFDFVRYAFRFFSGNIVKYRQYLKQSYPRTQSVSPGYAFGELQVHTQKYVRSTTFFAVQDCFFGVLDQVGYESTIIDNEKKKMRRNMNILQASLFPKSETVSLERMIRLSSMFTRVRFQHSNYLYQQDDNVDAMYFIKTGEIQLSSNVQTNLGTQEFKITQLSQSEFVNDVEHFQEQKKYLYNAKVISVKCTLFCIKQQDFKKILAENIDIKGFLDSRSKDKYKFYISRIHRYQDMRFKNQTKKRYIQVGNSKIKHIHQLSQNYGDKEQLAKDQQDLLSYVPQYRAVQLQKIVQQNEKSQAKIGNKKVDLFQLFLLTKQVCKYQLGIKNLKLGKKMDWEQFDDQDDIKKQVYGMFNKKDNILLNKIEKQSFLKEKPSFRTNISENDQGDSQNMYMVTTKPKASERTWRLFAKAHQHYFTDESLQDPQQQSQTLSQSEEKSFNIHLNNLKRSNLKSKLKLFKCVSQKDDKFSVHLQTSHKHSSSERMSQNSNSNSTKLFDSLMTSQLTGIQSPRSDGIDSPFYLAGSHRKNFSKISFTNRFG